MTYFCNPKRTGSIVILSVALMLTFIAVAGPSARATALPAPAVQTITSVSDPTLSVPVCNLSGVNSSSRCCPLNAMCIHRPPHCCPLGALCIRPLAGGDDLADPTPPDSGLPLAGTGEGKCWWPPTHWCRPMTNADASLHIMCPMTHEGTGVPATAGLSLTA